MLTVDRKLEAYELSSDSCGCSWIYLFHNPIYWRNFCWLLYSFCNVGFLTIEAMYDFFFHKYVFIGVVDSSCTRRPPFYPMGVRFYWMSRALTHPCLYWVRFVVISNLEIHLLKRLVQILDLICIWKGITYFGSNLL